MTPKILLIGLLIFTLALSGCVEQKTNYVCSNGTVVETASVCPQETAYSEQELNNAIEAGKQENLDFFKEYSIALNDLGTAKGYLIIAEINRGKADDYTLGEYYYDDAEFLLETSKENVLDSEDYLNHAKKTLQQIQGQAPNAFFRKDVQNRVVQIEALLKVTNGQFNLSDNLKNYLYAINNESEERADEILEIYNKTDVPEYNNRLIELSEIENEIDSYWDRNWYSTIR